MFYIDTSSLLKLLVPEPESPGVRATVAAESLVLVSVLAQLEAEVQLRARWLGGHYTRQQHRGLSEGLIALCDLEPFEFHSLPGGIFERALEQLRQHERPHVRTLDRLHLAAMAELGADRLMTHDAAQAAGAKALGFEVLTPA
jgi:predicted nucleic acid-binding protein